MGYPTILLRFPKQWLGNPLSFWTLANSKRYPTIPVSFSNYFIRNSLDFRASWNLEKHSTKYISRLESFKLVDTFESTETLRSTFKKDFKTQSCPDEYHYCLQSMLAIWFSLQLETYLGYWKCWYFDRNYFILNVQRSRTSINAF